MPMGLISAPTAIVDCIIEFQTSFRQVVVLHRHDILTYSKDRDKHITYLNTVVQTIREH